MRDWRMQSAGGWRHRHADGCNRLGGEIVAIVMLGIRLWRIRLCNAGYLFLRILRRNRGACGSS